MSHSTARIATGRLDPLDQALVRHLQRDGRRSLTELAQALHVSHGTVRNRFDRLRRSGIITVAAIVDPAKVGFPIRVIMALNAGLAEQETIERALADLEEVSFVAAVAGRFDFIVEALFTSDAHLREFLVRKLSRIKGIQNTETLHVLTMGKRTWHWEIPRKRVKEEIG